MTSESCPAWNVTFCRFRYYNRKNSGPLKK